MSGQRHHRLARSGDWLRRSARYIGLALLAIGAAFFAFTACNANAPGGPGSTSFPIPTLASPPDESVTAMFIGDSYSQGVGASSADRRWTSLVAVKMGWVEVNNARGGTGYLATPGLEGCGMLSCPNYLEMLQSVSDSSPDIVFIAGGQNDVILYGENLGEVVDAVAETFALARDLFPDSRIIAVGPSTPWSVEGAVVDLDRAVQDTAAAIGAEYVSLISPNVIRPDMLGPDGAHVTDSGQAAIANRVLDALRRPAA